MVALWGWTPESYTEVLPSNNNNNINNINGQMPTPDKALSSVPASGGSVNNNSTS